MSTTMCTFAKISLVLFFVFKASEAHLDRESFRILLPFRECLGQKYPGLCLKERALNALDTAITSEQPLTVAGMIEIGRNPDYRFNRSDEDLPDEVTARSSKLNDVLYNKIEDFFKSRVFKFNMSPAFDEARGKKDKGKGGMMMLAMGGMACMVAQMFMGKIAFLAGTALIMAKVAFFISAIVGLKKLAGGGGGGKETSHVVYATDGHSHGGGGWHRSMNTDAHNIVYRAHVTEASSGF